MGSRYLKKTTNSCYSPALAHRVSLTEEVLPRVWAPRILPSSTPGTVPLLSVSLPFLKHTKHDPTAGPSPFLFPWSEACSPIPTAQQPHVCPSPTIDLTLNTIFLVSPSLATRLPVLPVVFLSMSCIKIGYATYLFSCLLSSLLPPSPQDTHLNIYL